MRHARTLAFLLSGAALLLSARAARAEEPATPAADTHAKAKAAWVKVWSEAKAKAKKENKDLLIDFTGSDWCGPCMRLHEEVFVQDAFLDAATKSFVLVYMDYPRTEEQKKEVVDAAENERVREAYGVNSFPTIILTTADGMPYARTGGYTPGGPEPFLKTIEDLRPNRAKVQALQAKGRTDVAAFKPGFDVLVEGEFLDHADFAWVLDQALKHDADGSKGFRTIVEAEQARRRSAAEEKALRKLVRETPPEARWQKIHEFLKSSKDLRGMILVQAAMNVGAWLLNEKKDYAEAKRMFQLPLRDPEIAADEEIKGEIEKAVKAADEAANPKPAEPEPEAPTSEPTKAPEAPKDPK